MKEYLRQKQTITTPYQSTPERSQTITTVIIPRPEASPMRKHSKNKLSKPRKVNVSFHPDFMQKNWLAKVKAKEAEAVKQATTLAQPAKALAT